MSLKTLHCIVRLCDFQVYLLKKINGEKRKPELINNLPNEDIAGLISIKRAIMSMHIRLRKTNRKH